MFTQITLYYARVMQLTYMELMHKLQQFNFTLLDEPTYGHTKEVQSQQQNSIYKFISQQQFMQCTGAVTSLRFKINLKQVYTHFICKRFTTQNLIYNTRTASWRGQSRQRRKASKQQTTFLLNLTFPRKVHKIRIFNKLYYNSQE